MSAGAGSGGLAFEGWAFCDPSNSSLERPGVGYGQSPCSEAVRFEGYPINHGFDRCVSPDSSSAGAWWCAIQSLRECFAGASSNPLRAMKNRSSFGRGVAYLHRLIVCGLLALAAWLPTTSHASFPATPATACTIAPCYGPWYGMAPTRVEGDVAGLCGTMAAYATSQTATLNYRYNHYNYSPPQTVECVFDAQPKGGGAWYASGGAGLTRDVVAPAPPYTCPSGSTLGGSSCTCQSPNVQNAAGTACVGPCDAGQTSTTTAQLGWFNKGDLVGVYAAQTAAMAGTSCLSGFGAGGGSNCTVTLSSTAPPLGLAGVNGHSSYTTFLKGTSTGATCGSVSPIGAPSSPEPPCAGQSGVYNGIVTCLAPESQQSIDDRAAAVAAAAASAARLAAINAGRTAAVADQAAAAAGSAAAQASRNGSTAAQAAAAGAAAGTAAATAAAGGASSSSTMSQGSAAGAGQAAADRATAVATAAGLSPTLVTQAASSASAAASIAAAQVLNNGGTVAQANAAAAVAGQAATASIIYGSTPSVAGDAGAAAAAGNLAGATNGTGSGNNTTTGTGQSAPQDPVGDFCTKNPQAQMCKRTPDSSFGGACGSPPVCEGDAVMCAVAAATFQTNCSLSSDSAVPSLVAQAISGSDGQNTDAMKASRGIVNVGSFNSLGRGWSRSCPADPVVDLAWAHRSGTSFTLPLSRLCGPLGILANVAVAITLLGCIVFCVRSPVGG